LWPGAEANAASHTLTAADIARHTAADIAKHTADLTCTTDTTTDIASYTFTFGETVVRAVARTQQASSED
jgi:hypothetical protein